MDANETTRTFHTITALPRLLNWEQTCATLGGISRATLHRITRSGAIRVTRIGGNVRWSVDAIADYLDSVTFPSVKEVTTTMTDAERVAPHIP
jgi:predicted DNA-binding transcriptional regulator AlpA